MSRLLDNADTEANPMESDERDRADMVRLVDGHDPALNALMERHAPKLFNYLLRSLQNEDDAADLAQETFVRVYQNRTKFDPGLKFSSWLYAIASNLVRTQFRYRTRHPQPLPLETSAHESGTDFRESFPLDQPNPSEHLQTSETANAVRKAIASLPEELRTPLILFEYEELSHPEIATILNCTAKAVETRLYRARNQLKTLLNRLLQ
jgi:RNA polymerase sigma-70 factor (ECF subfamily)